MKLECEPKFLIYVGIEVVVHKVSFMFLSCNIETFLREAPLHPNKDIFACG